MSKLVLCPNPGRDKDYAFTQKMYELLRENGYDPVVCPLFERYGTYDNLPANIRVGDLEKELPLADMVIAFGGDGTILYTARVAAAYNATVLGVNLGNKGFVAELEPGDTELLLKAVKGDFTIDRRMMLDVRVLRGGKEIFSNFALNDVVVGGIARVVDISVFGDDRKISEFSGDGIVVATPTGSTAYSMAAGGPIVEPAAENIIITPICAHALIARSFVLAPERQVSVRLGQLGKKSAYLSVDGEDSMALESGDELRICRSQRVTKLAHVAEKSFYEKVSEKLGERK